jgi:hypothetical protein
MKLSQYKVCKAVYAISQRYSVLANADQDNFQMQINQVNAYRDFKMLCSLYNVNAAYLANRLDKYGV